MYHFQDFFIILINRRQFKTLNLIKKLQYSYYVITSVKGKHSKISKNDEIWPKTWIYWATSMLVTDVGDEISWWQLFDIGDEACHQDIDVGKSVTDIMSPT